MWKSKGIQLVLTSLVILALLAGSSCGLFNKPPVITSLTPTDTEVARGASCTVNCVASDPNADDTLTYSWTATGGAISGTGSAITWIAPTTVGSYSVTVAVSDGKKSVSDSCTIQVINTPPTIASLTPSSTDIAPEESCTIGCVASDADADSLTYTWTATGGTITGTGNSVSWEAPAAEGTYTISVSVSDGQGGTASDSCDITVEMKYGSINIQSDPAGAAVFLDGVDTGNITPFVITNVLPGSYTVTLDSYHYKYRQATVTVTANETTYLNWSLNYAPELTLTIQPNAAAGIDTYVYEPDPIEHFGNDSYIFAGAAVVDTCRAYLQFSLALLPEDIVITSARVGLNYVSTDISATTAIGAYPVLGAWSETTITWNNQPAFATTPEYSYNVPAAVSNAFIYWYITDMVGSWHDGSLANFGLVLKSVDESAEEGWKGFNSSDGFTDSQHPKLIITYYDPNP
ncbi:MAG: DNRLRE domain-containing protein [Dehalococcoidales bacterium]|nr:DNRLRE domain-containing protein [Dehalococcoidales bacterium]